MFASMQTKYYDMKNKINHLLPFLALIALFSCNGEGHAVDERDSSQAESPVDPTDLVSADTLSDSSFVAQIAQSGLAEVVLGNLALKNSSDTSVRRFAGKMIHDHSNTNRELKAISGQLNLKVPSTLGPEKESIAEELRTRAGLEFDIAYANAMVDSHSKALVILDQRVGKLGNEKLKTFAEKTSKLISEHLEHARDLQRTVR